MCQSAPIAPITFTCEDVPGCDRPFLRVRGGDVLVITSVHGGKPHENLLTLDRLLARLGLRAVPLDAPLDKR